jgi:hypothetical protein
MRIDLPIEIFTYPDVPMPTVWSVKQRFDTPSLTAGQIEEETRRAIDRLAADPRIRAGATVAIGVGSRGLDNLVPVVRCVVAALRERGALPFIIPAMGSHGGATAEGQIEVLHSYGVTEESVGAEIRATMEVRQIGVLDGPDAGPYAGQPVFCELNALSADAIVLINRIKAHTDFRGPIESGIAKMSVIGLGKRHGAESVHRHGATGLRDLIPRIARYLPEQIPLIGGVALIENELGRTSEIHALRGSEVAREPEQALLNRAREIAPRLPYDDLDILIIDEMGKNISGAGMDTHVIGRGFMPSIVEKDWGGPNIRIVAVLDLTAPSHGNITALGVADMTTRKLIEKADFEATYVNMRTSGEGGVLRARLPLIMPTSDDCVKTAIATCGRAEAREVRLARIRNTADTQVLEISEALLAESRANPRLEVAEEGHTLDLCVDVRTSGGWG